MNSIGRAVWYGFLSWLWPFVIAVGIFPLKKSHTPLFESLMAVVVSATAVLLGCRYLQRHGIPSLRAAITLGSIWLLVSIGVDLPLFSWGPMKRSLADYMMDIGLTYLIYPIVLAGLYIASRPPNTPSPEATDP
jgi:hypothetical protein